MSEHLREGPFDFDFFGGGVGFCNFGKFVKIKKNKTMHCWEKKLRAFSAPKEAYYTDKYHQKTHTSREKNS